MLLDIGTCIDFIWQYCMFLISDIFFYVQHVPTSFNCTCVLQKDARRVWFLTTARIYRPYIVLPSMHWQFVKMKDLFILRQVPNSTICSHQGRVAHHLHKEVPFNEIKIYLKNLPHNHKYTRLSVFIKIYLCLENT